ncbi:hypothetical protein T439DRAFT_323157 [Meredithblackwellia eburnea MCA 4105]
MAVATAQPLPAELLTRIFSKLRSLGSDSFDVNKDLFAAALVCKNWRAPAEDVLHRDLHLNWRPSIFHRIPDRLFDLTRSFTVTIQRQNSWVERALASPQKRKRIVNDGKEFSGIVGKRPHTMNILGRIAFGRMTAKWSTLSWNSSRDSRISEAHFTACGRDSTSKTSSSPG